jgi:serine protease Do
VDLAGEVIGINTAIITGSRGYEGVGFALPSSVAINVYNQLVQQGRVTRGSIGVSFQEELGTNAITLKELGAPNGVVIMGVEPGSPAEKAGLKGGDVITNVNGQAVKTGNDLVNPIAQGTHRQQSEDRLRARPPGEGNLGGGRRSHSRLPEFRLAAERFARTDSQPAEFGLRVENLTPERASRVGMEGQKGVLVVDVDPASFGDDLNFTRGDVIAEVNRQPVSSVAEYKTVIGKLKPGDNVGVQGSPETGQRPHPDRILARCRAGRERSVKVAGQRPIKGVEG